MDGTDEDHVGEDGRTTPGDRASTGWAATDVRPTARQRMGAQQAVRRVLDALVPERTPARHIEPRGVSQRYRSPRGCILQGEGGAVSVSWFPAQESDDALGELQVIAWAGVVSRPGASNRAVGGARPVAEELFRPVESASDEWVWRTADGSELDTRAVVDRCLALLAEHAAPPEPVAARA